MMGLPDLSMLEDIPRKTDEMQASLERIEKLLRVLVEIQAHVHTGDPFRLALYEKYGIDG